MSIREDREFLKNRRAERDALKENADKAMREDFNNMIIARENIVAAHESKLDRFYEFKDSIKKNLLKEALMHIYEGSFYNITYREHTICENLLEQYIGEVGVSKLLHNMKFSESNILHVIADNTDKYYKKISEGANAEDESTQIIKSEDIKNFWKDIDKSDDVDDITNMIQMRVSNAEEDFVNKNMEDKENVKTILQQTAQRVRNAKSMNDNDYEEAVEESETKYAKNQIYKVQHEGHHNVFHRMVKNLAEAAMMNEDAKKEFTTDNGRLDMDKIVESARCMYTLLEMVGTIELEKVDQQYIEDTLKSIK